MPSGDPPLVAPSSSDVASTRRPSWTHSSGKRFSKGRKETAYMRRDEILQALGKHRLQLKQLGVASLAVFGSVARDEAAQDSDVEVLVEFDQPVGLFEVVRLRLRLEEILDRPVDLVTRDALRPSMREQILGEAVYAV